MSNTNEMVAHIWAQQEKDSAKSANGNFSFRGETLFSYRTPIARFVQSIDGRRVILVTSDKFSMTTSCKHMPALWRSIGSSARPTPCFSVPIISHSGAFDELDNRAHSLNLAHLMAEYDTLAARLLRARYIETYLWRIKINEGIALDKLQERADAALGYASAFGLALPFLDAVSDAREIWRKRQERAAKNSTPEAIAKRERARVKRIERQEAKQAEERRIALLDGAELIAAWRDGQGGYSCWRMPRTDESNGAFLRIRGDNLETSLGAKVPLSHAIRVFQFVKLCRERNQEWKRNGKTLRVGHFQVDSINPDGSFRAGCHFISWHEIERVARKHGLFDVDAIDTTEQKEMAA
jgi:hypothetical protein